MCVRFREKFILYCTDKIKKVYWFCFVCASIYFFSIFCGVTWITFIFKNETRWIRAAILRCGKRPQGKLSSGWSQPCPRLLSIAWWDHLRIDRISITFSRRTRWGLKGNSHLGEDSERELKERAFSTHSHYYRPSEEEAEPSWLEQNRATPNSVRRIKPCCESFLRRSSQDLNSVIAERESGSRVTVDSREPNGGLRRKRATKRKNARKPQAEMWE